MNKKKLTDRIEAITEEIQENLSLYMHRGQKMKGGKVGPAFLECIFTDQVMNILNCVLLSW
jgi:hypothetical protein